jgi:transcriptional regulator with XRE-family HTH domain
VAKKSSLGKYLRDARLRRNLTVAELAEKVGVTDPCIYFWESGKTRPRESNLTALCKALKLPIRVTREIATA